MTFIRAHWEGASLPGDYKLEQWLSGDDSAALFQAQSPDGGSVRVKLVAETTGQESPLDLWYRIGQLRHPNLIELLDFGRVEHNGEATFYAVFETSDETLADALRHTPLHPQESRDVLDSVLDVLRYLHAQGLALGALDSARIFAVGDRIKLATDSVQDADNSAACRKDIRLLGELWHEALLTASPRSAEIAAHAADRDPRARWTLAEIRAALNPPLPPPAPLVARQAVAAPLPMAPATVPPRRPVVPIFRYQFPKWPFLAATAALLVLIFPRPRAVVVVPRSPLATVSSPTNAAPPPIYAVPATPPQLSPATAKNGWRVIAFTYRTRDAADRKVQQLNQRHPGLQAQVFAPKENGGYYLVSLGGPMAREEALRLQQRARRKGLPPDLYVQNYAE